MALKGDAADLLDVSFGKDGVPDGAGDAVGLAVREVGCATSGPQWRSYIIKEADPFSTSIDFFDGLREEAAERPGIVAVVFGQR